MNIELNTNLFRLINVGTYESWLDPRYLVDERIQMFLEEDGYNEDFIGDFLWEFDFTEYKKDLDLAGDAELQILIHEPLFQDFGVETVETHGIVSPREYNFKTDELDFTITTHLSYDNIADKFLELIEDVREKVEKFLDDNYSDRSGFWSFTPNNIEDLVKEIQQGEEVAIGAMLSVVAYIQGYEQEVITESIMESMVDCDFWEYFPELSSFRTQWELKNKRSALKESEVEVEDE